MMMIRHILTNICLRLFVTCLLTFNLTHRHQV